MADFNEQGPTTGLTPHLTIAAGRAVEAVAFYERAFGAALTRPVLKGDDSGLVMHAHLRINDGSLMLNDEFLEYQGSKGSGGPVTLHLQVDDADAWFVRAIAAGCEATMPLADLFWGDRYGQLRDPFGQTWAIASPIRKQGDD